MIEGAITSLTLCVWIKYYPIARGKQSLDSRTEK